MPDVFVPEDTVGMTSYYISVSNAGLLQQYAYDMAEKLRPKMKGVNTVEKFESVLPSDDQLLEGFVDYAAEKCVPARWY